MLKLIGLSYSAWTLKVKWFLRLKGASYDYQEHVPILGEIYLKYVLGSKTVPVLIDGDLKINQTFAICKYLDYRFKAPKLLPEENENDIYKLAEWADEALDKARKIAFVLTAENDAAIKESHPDTIPSFLHGPMVPISKKLIKFLLKKYDCREDMMDLYRGELEESYKWIATKIKPKSYLTGEFSYADIAVACALQGLAPVDEKYCQMGSYLKMFFTQPCSSESWAQDLLAWRDWLFDTHW